MPLASPPKKSPFAKKSVKRLSDFSGGLNTAFSPLLLGDNEVAEIENFNYDEKGTLKKRTGFTKRYSTTFATGAVHGLYNYRKEDGRSYLIIAADGKVFSDNPNFTQTFDTQAQWGQANTVFYSISTTRVVGDIVHDGDPASSAGNVEAGGAYAEAGGRADLYEATWHSNSMDISTITDKTTGRITQSVTLPAGTTRVIETRVSLDGVTWDAWTALGAGDTIVGTDPTDNFLQVRIRLNSTAGLRPSIQKLEVFFDTTSSPTSIGTGLSTTARFDFATQNDTLWIVNGEDTNRKWDGTTFGTQAGSPPVGKYIIVHKNRMFIAGNSTNRSRLYFSELSDPENWPALNFIDVGKGDGDAITGFMILLDSLIVFKENSVWVLNGDSASTFVLRRASDEAGAVDFRSLAIVKNAIVYLSRDAVRFFDGVRTVVGSEKIEPTLKGGTGITGLNPRQLALCAGIVFDGKYYLAAPEGTMLSNDVVLVFDILRQAWTKYRGIKAGEWVIWRQFNEDILLFGSSLTGQVFEMGDGLTDDGTAISAFVVTKSLDIGSPETLKLMRSVLMTAADSQGRSTTASVALLKDLGDPGTAQTVSISGDMSVERVVPSLGGVSIARALAVKVVHNDSAADLSIRSVAIEFIPKSVRESA